MKWEEDRRDTYDTTPTYKWLLHHDGAEVVLSKHGDEHWMIGASVQHPFVRECRAEMHYRNPRARYGEELLFRGNEAAARWKAEELLRFLCAWVGRTLPAVEGDGRAAEQESE